VNSEFSLPLFFDIGAVFFFALTGALAAMRRGYDIIGLFTLAFVTGLGGALIRDGLFLQNGPPALTRNPDYMLAVLAACVVGWLLGRFLENFSRTIAAIDAVGLGAYSVVGVAKSLTVGLSDPAALMVGVVNACGGSVLRDILCREESMLLKPGQFYALVSLIASALFIMLTRHTALDVTQSALITIVVTFFLRILTIAFNWQTRAVEPWEFSTIFAREKSQTLEQIIPPVDINVTIVEDSVKEPEKESERENSGANRDEKNTNSTAEKN
jgi:uncharacterized membrane protein YeiH